MVALTLAEVAYLLAIREFFRGQGLIRICTEQLCATAEFSRRAVVMGLVLAAVWHVEFLRRPVGMDDDIHRYVWDGRLQRLGYNPYLVIPSDLGAKDLHTAATRNLNNPNLASPYPAGAQLFFRAITAIHESTFAFRVAFVLCELTIVLVLFDLLRRTQQPAHLVLAFAWNPLLAIEVAGSGHIDIVGALLLIVSAAALVRRWRAAAAIAFGLAVSMKLLPLVLAPIYWKRVRIRDAMLATAVAGLLYVPFLNHDRIPTGSLGTYVQTFRFNGPVFAALDRVAPAQWLAVLAVLAGLTIAILFRRRATSEWSADQFAWPMAAALLCAPAVFPWYLLALLPFLTSSSTLIIIVWTASIIPTYVQWHLRSLGRPWGALPGWVMLVEYGCVAAVALMVAWRRFTRRTSPQ